MRWIASGAVAMGAIAWLLAARYRPRGQWLILPVVVALIAGTFSINEFRWYRFEARLTRGAQPVLRAVPGQPATRARETRFSCERLMRNFWSSQGFVGHVWFDADGRPARTAFLSMDTCSGVKHWLKNPARASLSDVVAVHTVAHEAAHLAGLRFESKAECLAQQRDVEVMMALGATREVAQRQVAQYRAEVYPRLPEEYRDNGCRLPAAQA